AMTQLVSIQEFFMSSLVYMPKYLSEYLLAGWRVFTDLTFPPLVKYLSGVVVKYVQTPIDYVKIGLQFFIKIPVLNQSGQCYQDLKQLIMGMNHNVSWSFGESLMDIFLTPEPAPCSYMSFGCHGAPSAPSARTLATEIPAPLLDCDQHHISSLNETFCSEFLSLGLQKPTVLFSFCKAMSVLNTTQMDWTWRNGCRLIRSLLSPFLNESGCAGAAPFQPQGVRSPLSLSLLLCDYKNWTSMNRVDPALVTLCSDNDRTEFIRVVCHTVSLMHLLVGDTNNAWVWNFCSNFSDANVINLYCTYETWRLNMVDVSLVSFCWNMDRHRLERLLCDDVDFYMRFFSETQNAWLSLSCENLEPPISMDIAALVAGTCRYSDWRKPALVPGDVLQLCVQHDELGFVQAICSNSTFLTTLLQNKMNSWVGDLCKVALSSVIMGSPTVLGIKDWCNYREWAVKAVDPSVVGFCWQYDQISFHKNVCCIMPIYEKLILVSGNEWLTSVCSDLEMVDVLPQVCRYDDWGTPTIVDMTDLALCAELDSQNFTQRVCANATVLRNLLANLDNTWLLQHCSNHSGGNSPAGAGEDLLGFRPAEQCQYHSWTVALPDAALLALCWDYDQANFVSTICSDALLLSQLSQEPYSVWVATICPTYTNNTHGNSTASSSCLARDFVKRLNWSCSTDFTAACRPGAAQTLGLQLVLRCSVEALQPQLKKLLTGEVSSLVAQATTQLVLLLLALEERQMTSLHVTENIRLSVLQSVVRYLDREMDFNNKRVLLQCFGRVLTSLIQTGRDVTTDDYFHIKEYFRIPPASLRSVLSAVDVMTVRQILLYYSRNQDTLQDYLQSMVSIFFQTHLAGDSSLFPDLVPLLDAARPADILALPALQDKANLQTINTQIGSLSLEQRRAFGKWFSQSLSFLNMTAAGPSLITDIGNLITYLPFSSFQHLSPAQLLDGLDVLLINPLSPLQEQFVAQTILGMFTNLTLGDLTCLARPKDLLVYRNSEAFGVIQENVRRCVSQGLKVPSDMVSGLFLNSTELQEPASLSPERIRQLAVFLPWLGAGFLKQLSPSQLYPVLPELAAVPFTPVQGQLLSLGGLVSGLKVESIWALPSDSLLATLPDVALRHLSDPQANAIATKLWQGSLEVPRWLDQVEPLLSRTPLLCVIPRVTLLLSNQTMAQRRPWNTQQKKCIIEELYQFDFFSELLGELGSQIALELMSTIKKFSVDMMDTLREMVVRDPYPFLRLPSIKQALLVDKMTQRLRMYTGQYSEEEFRSLGIMATFVVDEVFAQLDRSFFVENLEFLRGFCYSRSKRDMVARFLQEPSTFSVMDWKSQTLEQVDRFIFFLPKEVIQLIPSGLVTLERIERLFLNQQQWETGPVGLLCRQASDQTELQRMFERQQFVLQFFLGFLRAGRIPSCENLHAVPPSAWSLDSLLGMSAGAFSSCLELIGQDPFLRHYELTQLLSKTYGPASSFSTSVVSQLGRLALRLTEEELGLLSLTELSSISALGAIGDWSTRQSKAVLWLGSLRLSCSEEQLQVLVALLSHSLAFGPISSWGPEVFIEIGALAGLPDMAMSALVKDQIEGITPLAVSLIPDQKFAVVFDQAQIRMFSYEQAIAVTEAQRSVLTTVQQTALAMVLTPWEDKPVDFR
uniref:Stereocilin 1 n=1 Tax=Paramormyrops kingsleyae TaxID=1676925 RepID=A0A3B3T1U9_9TELE